MRGFVLGFGLVLSLGLAGCGVNDNFIDYDDSITVSIEEEEFLEQEIITLEFEGESNIESEDEFIEDIIFDDDLLTADELINLVFEAKKRLYELDEVTSDVSFFVFGLIDVDFDGFPELFCHFYKEHLRLEDCKLYSLKPENFCELLTEYQAYGLLSTHDYMIKNDNGNKRLILYTNYGHHSNRSYSIIISEFENQDDNIVFKQLLRERWIINYFPNKEPVSEPDFFMIGDDDVTLEEYQLVFDDFVKDLTPAPYLYEDIIYHSDNVNDPQKHKEDYDILYPLYEEFLREF